MKKDSYSGASGMPIDATKRMEEINKRSSDKPLAALSNGYAIRLEEVQSKIDPLASSLVNFQLSSKVKALIVALRSAPKPTVKLSISSSLRSKVTGIENLPVISARLFPPQLGTQLGTSIPIVKSM